VKPVEPVNGLAIGLGLFLIVVTGLLAEARIASAPGLSVFACGGDVGLRASSIKQAVFAGAPAIVSFGIAGGLSPHLAPGDWVVATSVVSGDRCIETDIGWASRLAERLPGGELGKILSVSDAVLRPEHKRRLHLETGAAAVDMESFQAAALAEELGLPFAAVRVVADAAGREIPPAARAGLQADGTVAAGAVIRSLLRKPSQLPMLIGVTSDVFVAFRALLRGRHELGPHFASLWCPTVLENGLVGSMDPSRPQAVPIPA
jgi:hopanoid-associated phosphorylase